MVHGAAHWNPFLPLVLSVVFLACGSSLSLAADETRRCDPQTAPRVNCTCDLTSLRPLQGAVGMVEVQHKADKIKKNLGKEEDKLAADPIKVVRGPGGQLFVTDHHHGARAWLLAGYPSGVCSIERDLSSADPEKFWSQLKDLKKVHLENKDGLAIVPDALPKSLEQLPDDPYRSLAWMVRKDDGFCRERMEQKEFAEFIWADFMRDKFPAAEVAAAPQKLRKAAVELARSPAAAGLPGYVGEKPASLTCQDDD
jgi:hypothetical protein